MNKKLNVSYDSVFHNVWLCMEKRMQIQIKCIATKYQLKTDEIKQKAVLQEKQTNLLATGKCLGIWFILDHRVWLR